ncbi:hypothetical protein JRQ81_012831 [Phrynocephalus forsythii]|uniref:Transmembrane protein 70 n=1 Tax=Phrynocephalus forsythii TaxID=171643 RepID=A0A9Q0Y583_9SAUR|nr:hypothetical protein JRQ81_012831 [Phrynocephalus forsythii]
MLLLAALGSGTLGFRPWPRLDARWQQRRRLLLLLAENRPAAAREWSRSSGASWRSPRAAALGRGSSGFFPWMAENKQIPFGSVELLCCFSTSSTQEYSEYGRLIYSGPLAKVVAGVKFFSYSTSMFNIAVMTSVFSKTGVGIDSLALQIAFYSFLGFFTFVSPVALHLLSKGYVIRLYHKAETDTYTAFTYNVILAEKKTVFHQKEVTIPSVSKMFTTFYANSKSMLVHPQRFEYAQDFNHLMGYDKPFTFD